MDIKTLLKKARQKRELSLYALSKKSGVSQSFLSMIEAGKKQPTIATLEKICSALNMTPAEFFEGNAARDLPSHLQRLLEQARKLSSKQVNRLADFLSEIQE